MKFKKHVGFNTPQGVWLSLEEYKVPVVVPDVFESYTLLVMNEDESESQELFNTFCHRLTEIELEVINGTKPWRYFCTEYGEVFYVTHFLIVPEV